MQPQRLIKITVTYTDGKSQLELLDVNAFMHFTNQLSQSPNVASWRSIVIDSTIVDGEKEETTVPA